MTLSSASTDAQVVAEYDDTASYFESEDAALARRHVTATLILLRRMGKRSRLQDFEVELDPQILREDLRETRAWLAGHADGDGGVIHPSTEYFRDY